MMGVVRFDLWISVDGCSERRVLDAAELAHALDQQLSLASVYLEIGPSDGSYPNVMVSSNGVLAAIHAQRGEERLALLVGDGTLADRDDVDLPVDHEPACFTGRFVMSNATARSVLARFVERGEI